MASRSRKSGSIGRIWLVLYSIGWLWWQELVCSKPVECGISANKAVLLCLWRLVALVLPRSAGHSSILLVTRLSRWKMVVASRFGEAFFNKRAPFCRCGGQGWRFCRAFSSRRGVEDDEDLQALAIWRPYQQRGILCASLWRITTAVQFVPLFFMAVRQPLHPQDSVAVTGLQDLNNLQGFVPCRRPLDDGAVGSHLTLPSGHVPGDSEIGSVEHRGDGEGAGPDRVFFFSSKVLSAKYKGQFVFSSFLQALFVKSVSTAMIE